MGKHVGHYVQTLRQQRELSIRQVGFQTNISPSHLSLIERGQRETSIPVLYTLASHLEGNFATALFLLAADAGVPEEALWTALPSPAILPSHNL